MEQDEPTAKILISEAEYRRLKEIDRQQKKQQQEEGEQHDDEAAGKPLGGGEREEKLAVLQREAVRKENASRRRDLNPPSFQGAASDSSDTSEEEDDGGHNDNTMDECLETLAPYLTSRDEKKRAAVLLERLMNHPEVTVDRGCVVVDGERLGHVAIVLHSLLKDPGSCSVGKLKMVRRLVRASHGKSSPHKQGKGKRSPFPPARYYKL